MSGYLLVDYYSRFIEVARLKNMTADEVVWDAKSFFTWHGILKEVMSDNGPQFSSEPFRSFSQEYNSYH